MPPGRQVFCLQLQTLTVFIRFIKKKQPFCESSLREYWTDEEAKRPQGRSGVESGEGGQPFKVLRCCGHGG